jgi:hypothetical protein
VLSCWPQEWCIGRLYSKTTTTGEDIDASV